MRLQSRFRSPKFYNDRYHPFGEPCMKMTSLFFSFALSGFNYAHALSTSDSPPSVPPAVQSPSCITIINSLKEIDSTTPDNNKKFEGMLNAIGKNDPLVKMKLEVYSTLHYGKGHFCSPKTPPCCIPKMKVPPSQGGFLVGFEEDDKKLTECAEAILESDVSLVKFAGLSNRKSNPREIMDLTCDRAVYLIKKSIKESDGKGIKTTLDDYFAGGTEAKSTGTRTGR